MVGTSLRTTERRKAGELGFSLTELMVVIVLISILAALAMPALQKRVQQARGRVGAIEMRAIAGAQERFRSENMAYLDVSPSLADYYPVDTPTAAFRNFRSPAHADFVRWEVLGPAITELTPYTFATKAGLAGAPLPAGISPDVLAVMPAAIAANANANPWYVVQGRGDIDGNGREQVMFLSSFDPVVYLANEGE